MSPVLIVLLAAFAQIDPQRVQDQQDMTWADYHPIPGINWADPSRTPSKRQFRVALIAVDFDDLPKKSDLFGNPQIDPIPREQVPQFYADFYNRPGALNHGQTINGYWMEQSRGQVGIGKIDAFGPYRMPKKLFQYGLNEWGQRDGVPAGYVADGRLEPDADALWLADAGDLKSKYDIILRIYAGYDETSVWQEFGEMKFQTRDDIPPEWGNPDGARPRWVVTRYEPWTSWKAGQMLWGLSSVRQGESSGTITHEIVHFAFRVGDNNNNPYQEPYHRAGSGPWDIMDRGSFNGPGGPHSRWVVPATQGASMAAGLMLRSKVRFEFLKDAEVLKVTRSGLAASGLVVAKVTARAVAPVEGAYAGVIVTLDGAGSSDFHFYSVEVVQRIGYDSFTPDNGVLLAKNKNNEGNTCGYNCFTWVIDAHPEDIRMVDFKRPNGEPVMRTPADYRQLNDALFHAGLNSGSQYEWEDATDGLHFYVIDVAKDERGILTYTVGVRSLAGAGDVRRGVALTASADCEVSLTNTAESGTDIYRLSVSGGGELRNALAAVKSGESQRIEVYGSGSITLRATSESDPTKSARTTCRR